MDGENVNIAKTSNPEDFLPAALEAIVRHNFV
jgi:hypothetical protein